MITRRAKILDKAVAMIMVLMLSFAFVVASTSKTLADSSVFKYEAENIQHGWKEGGALGALDALTEVFGDAVQGGVDWAQSGVNNYWQRRRQRLNELSNQPGIPGLMAEYIGKPLANVGKFLTDVGFGGAKVVTSFLPSSNIKCRQERMDRIYKSDCYPCKVVKALLTAFGNGVGTLNDVMVDASKKVLVLGLFLWIAFYLLQQLSSLKNLEPAAMINDLLTILFKALGAWLFIVAGLPIFKEFVLIPVLSWGLDFGAYLMTAASKATGLNIWDTAQVPPSYLFDTDYGFFPAKFLNDLMYYVGAVDGTVTSHMKLGHMITCHAIHKGAWGFGPVSIPHPWIWLCGASVWCMGFMITFAVLFYLIDIAFKIGFALVAFPIVMALWPFSLTSSKLQAVIKMIANAAAIFLFLAMTTAIGLVLIDSAFSAGDIAETGKDAAEIMSDMDKNQGVLELYDAIEHGENEKISDTFSLFGSTFLCLVFAYLYAFKTIRSTSEDYVNKFFPPSITKSTPLNMMLTGAVGLVAGKVKKGTKLARDIVATQGKNFAAGALSGKKDEKKKSLSDRKEAAKKKLDQYQSGNLGGPGSEQIEQGEQSKGDTLKKMTNMQAKDDQAMKEQDKKEKTVGGGDADDKKGGSVADQMERTGQATTQQGEAIKQNTKAMADAQRQGADAIASAGDAGAIATFGVSAAAGHATQAAMHTSAAATQVAGEVAGESMKITGKVIKNAAKVVGKTEKVGKKVNKALKKAVKQREKDKQKQSQAQNKNNNGENSSGNSKTSDDMNETLAKSIVGEGENKKK